MALAAIIGEVAKQPPRSLDLDSVKDSALHAPRTDKAGTFKLRQMGRKRRR